MNDNNQTFYDHIKRCIIDNPFPNQELKYATITTALTDWIIQNGRGLDDHDDDLCYKIFDLTSYRAKGLIELLKFIMGYCVDKSEQRGLINKAICDYIDECQDDDKLDSIFHPYYKSKFIKKEEDSDSDSDKENDKIEAKVPIAVVNQFLSILERRSEWGSLDKAGNNLIRKHPELLTMKFSVDDYCDRLTVAELFCQYKYNTDSGRDLLVEVLELGAVPTDKCWEGASEDGILNDRHIALIHAGYFPSHLDKLVNSCDDDPLENDLMNEAFRLLTKQVKPGDNFRFGDIEANMVEKVLKMPNLEPGVTHSKDGLFAKTLQQWKEMNSKEESSKKK